MIYISLIPIGLILNYRKEGKLFIKNPSNHNLNCVLEPVDPIFGYKNNDCSVLKEDKKIGFKSEFKPGKLNKTFDLLVIGGSVAHNFAEDKNFKKNLLEQLVNNKNLNNKYKELRIFNAALGGMKQPQGLYTYHALNLLNYRFDAILEISGFNEVALVIAENFKDNINPIYPRMNNNRFLMAANSINKSLLQKTFDKILWIHPFHQYISTHTPFFTYLRVSINHSKRKKSSLLLGIDYLLPKNEFEAFSKSKIIYTRSTESIYELTNLKNIPYLLVIQPNQYLKGSKIFSEIEKNKFILGSDNEIYLNKFFKKKSLTRRYGESISKYYGLLEQEDFNIPVKNIIDLRKAFLNKRETIYIDSCCHINNEGRKILRKNIIPKLINLIDDEVKS